MRRPEQKRWRHLLVMVFGLLSACAASNSNVELRVSPARTAADAGLIDVAAVAPGLMVAMRYFGTDNFVGSRVDGYLANRCLLHKQVADALARVEQQLRAEGFALEIFDCYRPTVAVAHFMRWAADTQDQRSKADYYPRLDKSQLVPDYIAERSGHSRGATVDLGLLDCRAGQCQPVDMGTRFDFFDEAAHTESPLVSAEQHAHRLFLRKAMAVQGFQNYPLEWWHFRFEPEPTPQTEYAFPVQ